VGERRDPVCNTMSPGLLAIEIEGGGWLVALAIRRANKRFNRIYYVRLSSSRLHVSILVPNETTR
jgi:hypothetical protein